MLKQRVKTVVASVLLLTMVFALAGCGKGNEGKSTGAVPTLKYYFQGGNSVEAYNLVEEKLNPYLEEKIGCHIDVIPLDGATWNQKYPIMLSTGEEMDLMFSASWSGYLTQVGQGSFLALDDLLDKYGKGIKEVIADGYLDAAKVNGKLYAIPANKDVAQGYALYIDKGILEEAGVKEEDIQTIEDIEPILAYLKANKKDITPIVRTLEQGDLWLSTEESLKEGYMDQSKLESGFDSWGGIIAFDKAAEEFKLLSPENSEVYTSAARLMNKWYKAGYFMDGIIAGNDDPAGLWKEGKYWQVVSSDPPGILEGIATSVKLEPDRIAKIVLREKIKNTNSMIGSLTAIPHSSKNPELAMKFLNLVYTDEYVANLMAYGIEGVHYEKVSDNVIKSIPDSKWGTGDTWKLGNTFVQYIPESKGADYLDRLKEYNDTAASSAILGYSFNSEPVKTEVAAITSVYEKYKRIFWTGAGDVEKNLDEYFEQIKVAGIDKVVDEYNKQYKEWKANNK